MKKGFTLIELLAVIVILAIIAVIATPIVLNIIKDAQKSANLRGIENYVESINLAISKNQMSNNEYSDGYHNIKELNLDVNGKIPESGFIYIKKGKLVSYSFTLDKKEYDDVMLDKKQANELEISYLNNTDVFSITGISFFYDNTMGLKYYEKKKY